MTTSGSQPSRPVIRTVLIADVKCYLCGAISGSIESERQPVPRNVTFRKVGEQTALPVLDWRRLRCERCGGPIYLDDADIVTRRVETYNWMDERPRRGRPPKRLAEERQRDREQLESQAA